jgi:hypothetical protein
VDPFALEAPSRGPRGVGAGIARPFDIEIEQGIVKDRRGGRPPLG